MKALQIDLFFFILFSISLDSFLFFQVFEGELNSVFDSHGTVPTSSFGYILFVSMLVSVKIISYTFLIFLKITLWKTKIIFRTFFSLFSNDSSISSRQSSKNKDLLRKLFLLLLTTITLIFSRISTFQNSMKRSLPFLFGLSIYFHA